jgi:hypothetical protein
MVKSLCTALAALASPWAAAHEGHGLPGLSHWHAGDTLLLLAGVGLVVGALARRRP